MAKADDDPAERERLAREAELEDGRMPFLSHLGELRDRLVKAVLWFAAGFLVCWKFADEIFAWLR
jgi:sec-independent protein translocase protein TatC